MYLICIFRRKDKFSYFDININGILTLPINGIELLSVMLEFVRKNYEID